MRIAYANANYRPNTPFGGHAHVKQFIDKATDFGHEIWTWSNNKHPLAHQLSTNRFKRLMDLQQMHAICTRIEYKLPSKDFLRWSIKPYKQLIGKPVVVWEFNSVPEFGLMVGSSAEDVQLEIEKFRRYSQECDIAVCVSNALSDYVRDYLKIQTVLTIENGSDPNFFTPSAQPVRRVQKHPDRLNVLWMGTVDLEWHDFEMLREAAWLLFNDQASSNISFHIIGTTHGIMRDMPPNVYCHGSESYEQLPHWLAAMDIGLCLYRKGAADYCSPLKAFDYMASGLTVVGTVHPQLKEVFDKLSQLDLLVPPDNPRALSEVLRSLSSNPDRIRYQGERGRQLVVDFYNWSRSTKDTLNAIEIVRDQRRAANRLAAL